MSKMAFARRRQNLRELLHSLAVVAGSPLLTSAPEAGKTCERALVLAAHELDAVIAEYDARIDRLLATVRRAVDLLDGKTIPARDLIALGDTMQVAPLASQKPVFIGADLGRPLHPDEQVYLPEEYRPRGFLQDMAVKPAAARPKTAQIVIFPGIRRERQTGGAI